MRVPETGWGVKVKEEEGEEEGSGGFSHPCICPLCLLGCLCVFGGEAVSSGCASTLNGLRRTHSDAA